MMIMIEPELTVAGQVSPVPVLSSCSCPLAQLVSVLVSSLSQLAPLLIAGDHYAAIIHPLRYQNLVTRLRSVEFFSFGICPH